MAFELPALPYADDALAPHISANTISFHYGKHHNAYVVNLNNLVKDTPMDDQSLEEIMKATAGDAGKAGIFNNSAQVWNHTFYWNSMSPTGGGAPGGDLAAGIDQAFGSYDAFKEQFKTACVTQFGSGWAWLVADGGNLQIVKTANAACPLTDGVTPLMTCDVWEHAYYLDFQNLRPAYVDAFLENLVNWDFAAENLANA